MTAGRAVGAQGAGGAAAAPPAAIAVNGAADANGAAGGGARGGHADGGHAGAMPAGAGAPGMQARGSVPRVSDADEAGAGWSARYDDLLQRAAAGARPLFCVQPVSARPGAARGALGGGREPAAPEPLRAA